MNAPDTILDRKQRLRLQIKQRIQNIADSTPCFDEYRRTLGRQAARFLRESPLYRKTAMILSYSALNTEFDTSAINENVMRDGKILALPRINTAYNTMEFFRIKPDVQLSPQLIQNRFGIWEPGRNCATVSPKQLSSALVLVPGRAFDSAGGRLGRGKSYYDLYLSRLGERGVIRIGVCFNEQMVDAVPMDTHDVGMDYILTEKGLTRCG
jgi:5-formyltetrahydrofolate cyclo-ligase